jgi:hypothetical protein
MEGQSSRGMWKKKLERVVKTLKTECDKYEITGQVSCFTVCGLQFAVSAFQFLGFVGFWWVLVKAVWVGVAP